MSAPTVPPPEPQSLNSAMSRNIAALQHRRQASEAEATPQERAAEVITRFTGSMTSVYLHAAAYGLWIAANVGLLPGLRPWDPTLVVLAMLASVEAIFLSMFILISQNRMVEVSDKRAELDLQVSLLAEHEITRLVEMVAAIADHLEIARPSDVEELQQNVAPEAVLDAIEEARFH